METTSPALFEEQAALEFAQTYGPLWVCGNTKHQPLCLWQGVNISDQCGIQHHWQNPEPVGEWLFLAREMRTAIELHLRLSGWKPPDKKQPLDWEALGLLPEKDDARWLREATRKLLENPELFKALLRGLINDRLWRYNIGLLLDRNLKPIFHGGLGFVPALWQQLAAVVAGGKTIAICCGCLMFYHPRRATKRGQRNYCVQCKERKVPQKEWWNKRE